MIWAILIGLVVGLIAKFLMPGRDPGGIIVTILLGIGGSMFANWLGLNMGIYNAGEFAGLIGSVIGAMLLLGIYRLLVGRRPERLHPRRARGVLPGRSGATLALGARRAPRASRDERPPAHGPQPAMAVSDAGPSGYEAPLPRPPLSHAERPGQVLAARSPRAARIA